MSDSKSFPFPLQLGVLDQFVHPSPTHLYASPVWHSGDVLTANSYIACRFNRGYWDRSDFTEAPADFLARFDKLPWARFHGLPDEWRSMDEVRGYLYKFATISPWTATDKCAPSPVWCVNGTFLARQSHLQLIARLPRCEVHLGVMGPEAPLLFRFNGGMGMLAADKKLTVSSFSIFEPRYHHSDDTRIRFEKPKAPTKQQEQAARDFQAREAALEARTFTYD